MAVWKVMGSDELKIEKKSVSGNTRSVYVKQKKSCFAAGLSGNSHFLTLSNTHRARVTVDGDGYLAIAYIFGTVVDDDALIVGNKLFRSFYSNR